MKRMEMQQKLRVLHLTFDMRIGGTEQVIKNLVESTDFSKFDVSILCIEQPIGPFGQLLVDQGVKIDSFQRTNGFDKGLIKNIRQYIKTNAIDVIHCHQYTPWFYGTLASMFSSVKVVFTEHGRFYPDSGSWKRRLINPVLSAMTSSITSISKATKQALIDFEYLHSNKVDVVYNGITALKVDQQKVAKLRQKLSLNDDNIVFGTVARLVPIKNQTLLIKAFNQVLIQTPEAKLLIVGDGEEKEKLDKLVSELGIEYAVIFAGYITQPVDYMALMDIFLLPSLSEGTSMTLLEAMSLSKPCVVTDAGGNPEVIKDFYNGYVTPNNELEPFFQKMQQLAQDKQLRVEFGENSHQRFLEIFTNTAMANSYMAIYNKVSGNK